MPARSHSPALRRETTLPRPVLLLRIARAIPATPQHGAREYSYRAARNLFATRTTPRQPAAPLSRDPAAAAATSKTPHRICPPISPATRNLHNAPPPRTPVNHPCAVQSDIRFHRRLFFGQP